MPEEKLLLFPAAVLADNGSYQNLEYKIRSILPLSTAFLGNVLILTNKRGV